MRRFRPRRNQVGKQHTTNRPPAAARGYDWQWRKVRNAHLAAFPRCQLRTHCTGAVAVDVDHVVPFKGRGDPLRLDPHNLQSACRACHNSKTHRQQAGNGRQSVPKTPRSGRKQ